MKERHTHSNEPAPNERPFVHSAILVWFLFIHNTNGGPQHGAIHYVQGKAVRTVAGTV